MAPSGCWRCGSRIACSSRQTSTQTILRRVRWLTPQPSEWACLAEVMLWCASSGRQSCPRRSPCPCLSCRPASTQPSSPPSAALRAFQHVSSTCRRAAGTGHRCRRTAPSTSSWSPSRLRTRTRERRRSPRRGPQRPRPGRRAHRTPRMVRQRLQQRSSRRSRLQRHRRTPRSTFFLPPATERTKTRPCHCRTWPLRRGPAHRRCSPQMMSTPSSANSDA
mmetsp:Transcript_76988/g.212756  ORF Transcript_76988/g.212756 Transcript_76988/m.212756 type:complete len:220 (-) Transcript_76988:125-784(-)